MIQRQAQNRNPRAVEPRSSMDSSELRKAGVRIKNLQVALQAAEGNLPALAAAANLGPQRIRDALDGKLPITREIAQHIEYSLKLSPAWLDAKPPQALPEEALARLRAALAGESLDDDDDEGGHGAAESAAPAVAAEAAPKKGAFEAAREKSKAPSVTFKRRRGAVEAAATASRPVEPAPIAAPVPAATATARKRGRKPGQISIPQEVQEFRLAQLRDLTREPGSKSRLCRLLGAPDSFISHLAAGRRTVTDAIAERICEVLELPNDFFTPNGVGGKAAASAVAGVTSVPAPAKAQRKRRPSVQDVPIEQGDTLMLAAVPAPAIAKPARPAPKPTPVAAAEAEQPTVVAVAERKEEAAPVSNVAALPAPLVTAIGTSSLDSSLKVALTALLHRAIAENKLTNAVALDIMGSLVKSLES